ncbi:DUF3320 domain-containing protein [Clostridium felsineum]|uniref:DUF3320 domain-containing protein n=1 Tax=Clostridium felsineum TaxID=36839 RepID=UPI00098CD8A8|nr:DUF3320 domain-containing protein [Clostridium felsineum]URZ18332.1 hypothetical protein CLFE_044020 [Clostridium felsineum DSM 794]
MSVLDIKIDNWKKKLLDLGKRNKLINYKENKRSTLKIVTPCIDELYKELVVEEKKLKFSKPSYMENLEDSDIEETNSIVKGDIETNQTIYEQQKTLSNLRNKSRLAKEEQGINTLYLSLGFLNWKENFNSTQILVSPIILIPVKITLESLTEPFILSLDDDEIVVNPTLAFKLENDFGIALPEFDTDEGDLNNYFKTIEEIVVNNNWSVDRNSSLSLLSFLKINMYKDLEKNRDKIELNPIITAISGEDNQLLEPSSSLNNYDHDNKTKPSELFQVLDADASQQDAILYAKKGISFVLQGPPGTGKSQTITNIISESLADGKKILFVSEKMAAIEVVYKRLDAAGLGDFCLTLHSYRANKKEIIKQLVKMLNVNKVKLQDEALYELDALKFERDKLNEYDRELHMKCEPFKKSIYEVNGYLSRLLDVESVIFNIENVAEIDNERFNEYKYYLEKFSKALRENKDDLLLNPWRNSNIHIVSNELRYDIEKHLKDLLPKLKEINNFCFEIIAKYKLPISISISNIKELSLILEISMKSPIVPFNWFNQTDIKELSQYAHELNKTKNEYLDLVSEIEEKYDKSYFLIDAKKTYDDLELFLNNVKKFLNYETYKDKDDQIINECSNIKIIIENTINNFEEVEEVSRKTSDILGVDSKFLTIEYIRAKCELLSLLMLNPKPIPVWFEDDKFEIIEKVFLEMEHKYFELTKKIEELRKNYDIKILDIDFERILSKFKTKYTSFFKQLNKNYRNDKNILKSYSNKVIKKIDDKTCVEVLNQIKDINDLKEYFKNNEQKFVTFFGNYFKKEYTNYEELKKSLGDYRKIKEYYGNEGIPDIIKKLLINSNMTEVENIYNKFQKCIVNNKDIDELGKILQSEKIIYKLDIISGVKFLQEILCDFNILEKAYNKLKTYSTKNIKYSDSINDLTSLIKIQNISLEISEKSNDIKNKFEFLYQGINSDWVGILNKLEWFENFKKKVIEFELPENFNKLVCGNKKFIEKVREEHDNLCEKYNDIKADFQWFVNLFEKKEELIGAELNDLIGRIELCLSNIALLEMWIDYRNSREKCIEIGLEEYIDKIENAKFKSNMIVPVFLKRFYRLWLDTAITNKPAIIEFRSRIQKDRISNFSRLDIKQLDIAKYRIKERLINSLPDANLITSSRDEVGILKREANKQRKIMSLRNLFKSIPELILTLKPCLMMSPLSVSMFLESDEYNFDVVIFDEASQVCTEDAIGAIYRGKQVIIAGDKEQLPPTNFFNSNISDEDFDDEEEDVDDVNSYESVLDEALSALPERTLLWHYRSKHEHLIAFSNIKIYGGNLITFPSNVDKVKDNGVEYIYVKDGIYERNGKKCNSIEAKKVAEMVFEHINKFPNRSLGVVTFSQSQQHAIEIAINDLRISNSKYEEFFNEDKEDAFFIKNLENVQGDERDTIIFSIGYAKDINGRMYMNLGPLSRNGGYRRLNVAITRAKYNIKLVGSILPTDIDLDRTNSKGVRMLKNYMEFAIQGVNALENEITVSESICLESPFEESVYDFLVMKGYNVITQVGCSGYRIDLAVKHPTLNGIFVIGIECDGAAYHSARTARERDRLRQSVLENIGWKIYRIWSTDWVKDRTTEGNKLIEAIDKAIAQYDNNFEDIYMSKNNNEKVSDNSDYLVETDQENLKKDNPFGFTFYKETNIYEVEKSFNYNKYLSDVIVHVVNNEYPIHFDLLCKRVAALFGNQKVTIKVKKGVKNAIDYMLNNLIEMKSDFCWLKGNEDVCVRIPSEKDENIRPIQYIAKEELSEAMITIIDRSFGIEVNDLLSITAKVFGFNRSGTKIIDSMKVAYSELINSKRIKTIDDKVIINNNES